MCHSRWPLRSNQARAVRSIIEVLLLLSALSATAAAAFFQTQASAATREDAAIVVIFDYRYGLDHVHAANPAVHLGVDRDPAAPGEAVLRVEYPMPTANPAGRDVWCDSEHRDWSAGRAIAFQVKPENDLRLSVSFLDRNGVAYTAWTDLKGGVWQPVRIAFDEIRPNPYFQPPQAKRGTSIDVSDVSSIGFAPQDRSSGSLAISRFVLTK